MVSEVRYEFYLKYGTQIVKQIQSPLQRKYFLYSLLLKQAWQNTAGVALIQCCFVAVHKVRNKLS